jgi:transcriptional regulator with XRE-family HTH domain
MTKLQAIFMKNLKKQRENSGLTQEQVAERSGIAHKYFGAIELGYKFPSLQVLEKLAETFGIPAYRLFVDAPQLEGMPSAELIDRYNEYLKERLTGDLPKARTEFLEELESRK